MKIQASVPILTLNCKPALERLLPLLVNEFDNVFIMDGNSTDGTQEYARSLGVRVEKQFDTDESNQRIADFYAMRLRLWSKAAHDWLFLIDADEMPTPKLVARIREIVTANQPLVVHRFCRLARLPDGRIVQRAFFYPDRYIRLFNRTSGATLAKRKVHERFVLPPGVSQVDHDEALIAPWPTPQAMQKKFGRYLELEAEGIQPTWSYLLRWVWWYNLRSALGQTLRACVASIRASLNHELALPWSYNRVMIGYRFHHILIATRAWSQKRRKLHS